MCAPREQPRETAKEAAELMIIHPMGGNGWLYLFRRQVPFIRRAAASTPTRTSPMPPHDAFLHLGEPELLPACNERAVASYLSSKPALG